MHVFKANQHILGEQHPENIQSGSTSQLTKKTIPSASEHRPPNTPQKTQSVGDATKPVQNPKESVKRTASTTVSESQDDEAWARAMLKELQLEEGSQDQPELLNKQKKQAQAKQPPLKSKKTKTPHSSKTKKTPASSFKQLKEEPLNLYYRKESPLKRTALPLACLFAGVILALQYFWVNFPDIASKPGLRPLASGLCSIMPCQLPELRDVSKVQIRNIVVRANPKYQNALTVDAIMTNEANFPQDYPDILMIISGNSQEILGTRIFSPSQYLSGEAAGARQIPTRQPIHLALEIINSEPNISNITFDIPD